MTARFKDARIDREGRLSLGRDHSTGTFYLAIPVSNANADYEEYFALDNAEFKRLRAACPKRGRSPSGVVPGNTTIA